MLGQAGITKIPGTRPKNQMPPAQINLKSQIKRKTPEKLPKQIKTGGLTPSQTSFFLSPREATWEKEPKY